MNSTIAPSPQKISSQLISSFQSAALLAALQLEVFTAIGEGSLTGDEIAAALKVKPRRLLPLLNVLHVSGHLLRDNDRYANTTESAYYLVKGKPSYIGGLHELYADLYRAVLLTEQSIREDKPAAEHDFDSMSNEELTAFFRGLHGMGVLQGRDIATRHDFGRFGNLADVGGGSGNIAIGACEACPGLRATVLELDRVVPIARQFIAEVSLNSRISVTTCDLTRQVPSDTFDVAVLRSFIQVLGPEQAMAALRNIGQCIRPGGQIYILGYVLNDEGTSPWEAAAYDVAFINIYQAGQSYTDRQYRDWMGDAGFHQFERQLMRNNMSMITARKR